MPMMLPSGSLKNARWPGRVHLPGRWLLRLGRELNRDRPCHLGRGRRLVALLLRRHLVHEGSLIPGGA